MAKLTCLLLQQVHQVLALLNGTVTCVKAVQYLSTACLDQLNHNHHWQVTLDLPQGEWQALGKGSQQGFDIQWGHLLLLPRSR